MNNKYLGDAFDYWKGSLLSLLTQKGLLHDFMVEPMITDEEAWSKDDLDTYCRLLNIQTAASVYHGDSTFSGKRSAYFAPLNCDGDLFLDPDTGIATRHGKRKHIEVSELQELLGRSDRVLMVYQHSGRGSFHKRLLELRNSLSKTVPNVHCAIYECGRVAVLFISLNEGRIQAIVTTLKVFLKGSAQARIFGHDYMGD